jgi:hypothetical protein
MYFAKEDISVKKMSALILSWYYTYFPIIEGDSVLNLRMRTRIKCSFPFSRLVPCEHKTHEAA